MVTIDPKKTSSWPNINYITQGVIRFIEHGADASRPSCEGGSYLHLWIHHHPREEDVRVITQLIDVLIEVRSVFLIYTS